MKVIFLFNAGCSMKDSRLLDQLLACPSCFGNVSVSANKYICCECQKEFPVLGNIPWLYKFPMAQVAEWRNKYNYLVQTLEQDAAKLLRALKASNINSLTHKRLLSLHLAKKENASLILRILSPLMNGIEGSIEISAAAQCKLPLTQHLMSYYPNIFRDWGWETPENEIVLEKVLKLFTADTAIESLVILGAGPCRLAADVHKSLNPKISVAIDINPFLFFVAKKILLRGETVKLYEFTRAPRGDKDHAVLQKCIAKSAYNTHNFHLILGDGLNPPIKAGRTDLVFTPWFVDIVPQDFGELAKLINKMLKVGGKWVNFGSLAFLNHEYLSSYSREEALMLLEQNGFIVELLLEEDIPYLCSPHSCQSRSERIFAFTAKKVADSTEPKRQEILPAWLNDHDLVVPKIPEYEHLVQVNRLYADIVDLIDGQSSVLSLAGKLAGMLNVSEEAARGILASLLENIHLSRKSP